MLELTEKLVDQRSHQAKDRMMVGRSKEVDLAKRTIEVVASTNRVDRDGEIIRPDAFTRTLPAFLASHAPLLASHAHRTDVAEPTQVGWVMEGRIERTRVTMQLKFAQTPAAESWWSLASDDQGKGIAVSIGFRPMRYIVGTAREIREQFADLADSIREAELADDRRLVVYTEIELYELSCVGVPSNRLAVQMRAAAKAFGIEDDETADTDALADLVAAKIAERLPSDTVASEMLDEIKKVLAAERQAILAAVTDRLDELIASLPDTLGQEQRGAAGPGAAGPVPGAGEGDDGADEHRAAGSLEDLVAYMKQNTRP